MTLLLGAALIAAGCTAHAAGPSPRVATDLPPSPTTWPPYPRFSRHSCWTRPFATGVMRAAPSFASAPTARVTPPTEIVRRLLARFGDRSLVHGIELGPPPPKVLSRLKGWFAGARPPRDALWPSIDAPAAVEALPPTAKPRQKRDSMLAQWEVDLVEGALRDTFCAAGGRPVVGWSVAGILAGVSDRGFALGQRFPNPSPRAFRARVEAVGKRYGFKIASLRLLRPVGLAPLLVVATDRARKAFVHDVPEIVSLLNPSSSAGKSTAFTFEGYFLEARDRRGAFVRVDGVDHGEAMGGEWSWNRCVYPYAHSEPVGAKPCPS